MRAALEAFDAGRYAQARALAADDPDPLAESLLDWLIARQPDSGMTPEDVISVMSTHANWPEPDRLRLRAEQAFHALGLGDAAVLAFYAQSPPLSIGGRLALAAALTSAGRAGEATAIIRAIWREATLSDTQAASVLARFGAWLTRDDHLYRFRRLALTGRNVDASLEAGVLGAGYRSLAAAVTAVLADRPIGAQLLEGVTPAFFDDPLYTLARAHLLRRSGQPIAAARLLLQIKPDARLIGDAGTWWDERRELSRALLDRGFSDLSYQIVAESHPVADADRIEASFHAGWYALRFLNDPTLAESHFRKLLSLATLPRTRAKASYWLGRALEAEGAAVTARLDYADAARFGGTFYGQLARQRIGVVTTGLERAPSPSALDRLRFAGRIETRAIRLLAAAGRGDLAAPFFRAVAERTTTPGEIALLTGLARRIEQPGVGMAAVATAERRGLDVASLPAPFLGVPAGLRLPKTVDRALVYAVARQESAFNHQAMSHVGARGLMQLMPQTAKATARLAQIPFSVERLTTDPLYNATLGAQHLGELLDRLRRSYILTFVGYNAGPGRARDWVLAYGDPRGGRVDPVDWIERIPFDETRNYVQKVMENLQVYRSRTGHPLSLAEDLTRGGPQG
jgi:soluble lytic murein transglycosylase